MTTEAQTQQQQQTQLTGFQQTYSHHTKIEEARVTVSIYSNDTETAKNEVLGLFKELKEALTK